MLRSGQDHSPGTLVRGLRIRRLRKQFGDVPVLKGIDLDVEQGELITVLGPSGSGKTTLLRLICGFESADAGRIELGRRVVADEHGLHLPPERRGIGYVAQEGALFPHLSVRENLLFGLPRSIRRQGRKRDSSRADALLELVGLPLRYADRKPSALSGGEQQRVALARALAPEPAMVLLDEPFSALDAGLRAGLREVVATSLKQVHTTALLVTHDQDEALSIGERVAVMHAGCLQQVDAPQALYRHPATAAIARFVGEAIVVPGNARGEVVSCCFGRLPVARTLADPPSGAVQVMLRPEQFRLLDTASDATARHARVEKLAFYGHDARLALCLDDGLRFTAAIPGIRLPAVGDQVWFHVLGEAVTYPPAAP